MASPSGWKASDEKEREWQSGIGKNETGHCCNKIKERYETTEKEGELKLAILTSMLRHSHLSRYFLLNI